MVLETHIRFFSLWILLFYKITRHWRGRKFIHSQESTDSSAIILVWKQIILVPSFILSSMIAYSIIFRIIVFIFIFMEAAKVKMKFHIWTFEHIFLSGRPCPSFSSFYTPFFVRITNYIYIYFLSFQWCVLIVPRVHYISLV